jgi:hypothetical protein
MDLRLKAWLIILLAVIVMTFACFTPAVRIDSSKVVPGWSAASLTIVGIFIGIAYRAPPLVVGCGLGVAANIIFIAALIVVMLRYLLGWTSRHRTLAIVAMLGVVASISSILLLRLSPMYVGTWLWLLAQATLAVGIWILPPWQRPSRPGFEVISIPDAPSLVPLAVANQ